MHSKIDPCLEKVVDNLGLIKSLVYILAEKMNVCVKEFYVFQSRATGDCNPDSDIDLYIQIVMDLPVFLENSKPFQDTDTLVLTRRYVAPFYHSLDQETKSGIEGLKLDLFWGVEKFPPIQGRYKDKPAFFSFTELKV